MTDVSRPADDLVGREEELAVVLAHLAARAEADASERGLDLDGGVVLAGPAGVGKSRLAREAADLVAGTGRVVHRHVATRAAASIPFGALLTLIPASVAMTGGGDNRLDVIRRVLERLRAERTTAGVPVVLVDDAHLLDEASAALLVQLDLERCAALLVTVRTGEPVRQEVTALWKDGRAARLDLQSLSLDQTTRLVSALLGGPVDERALDRIWRVTTGNPLFVREVVLNARRDGTLGEHRGLWTWQGDLRPDDRLVDAVRTAIGQADGGVRALVHTIAVADEVPVALLDHLPDSEHLADAERAGLLRVDAATDRVSLAHPLYGEILRAELPESEQRQRRAQLAVAIRAAGEQPDTVVWAMWMLDAGDVVDPSLLVQGAIQANALLEYDAAVRLASAAFDSADDAEPRLRAALALAFARNGQARWTDAAELLDGLVDAPGPADLRGRLALEHCRARIGGLDDVEGGLDALLRWSDGLDDPVWRDVVIAERATVLGGVGRADEAMALALPLLADGNDDRVRLKAFGAVAIELAQRGEVARVQSLANELLPASLVLRAEIPGAPFAILLAQLLCHTIDGNLDAIDAIVGAASAAYAGGDDEARALLLAAQGGVSLLRGRVHTAREQLQQAIGLLESSGRTSRLSSVALMLCEAGALSGDAALAQAALAQARTSLRANEARQEPLLRRAEAWERAVSEGPEAGRTAALAAADWAHARGTPWTEVSCLHDAVRMGAGRDAARRLAKVAGTMEGRMLANVASFGTTVAAGDVDGVLTAADGFAELGFELVAAEAAVVAARLARRAGDQPAAVRAGERAAAFLERVEGSGSPLIAAEATGGGPVLTRREREIVQRAAAGRSNREIADELVVSVRTVEGHLARAYAKLGIAGRDELAAVVDA